MNGEEFVINPDKEGRLSLATGPIYNCYYFHLIGRHKNKFTTFLEYFATKEYKADKHYNPRHGDLEAFINRWRV